MGLLKKVGKAMGHAIAQTGRATAAAIKRKNLQNEVKKMILERMKVEELKRLIKDNKLPDPPLPNRGYYKKEDYVKWAYRGIKLKKVIVWAQKHHVRIRDIMDYYMKRMEEIDQQYGKSKEEDKEQGVEDIKIRTEDFEVPARGEYRPPPTTGPARWRFSDPDEEFFYRLLRDIEEDYGPTAADASFVDEMAFKEHLKAYLIWKYRGHRITFQPKSVDLIIDDKFGLELKFAYNRPTLSKGYEEVKRYKKIVKYLAIVILDPGILSRDYFNEVLEDYRDLGAEVIVIRGGRKRDLKRKREIWAAQRIR